MTIQEAKNRKVYYLNQYQGIEESTYYDFVREFGSDETTTPNGVAPRKHIRENDEGQFEIWSWGIGGNRPVYYGDTVETREEAEQLLFEYFENEATISDQTPYYYESYKEALSDIE